LLAGVFILVPLQVARCELWLMEGFWLESVKIKLTADITFPDFAIFVFSDFYPEI